MLPKLIVVITSIVVGIDIGTQMWMTMKSAVCSQVKFVVVVTSSETVLSRLECNSVVLA